MFVKQVRRTTCARSWSSARRVHYSFPPGGVVGSICAGVHGLGTTIVRDSLSLLTGIQDLANIDPMYQYSLPFYVSLFLGAIQRAEPADELEQRIENVNDFFRLTLYKNICASLFERHKLLFSFLLCARLFLAEGIIPMSSYRYLLTGGVSMEQPPECPHAWVPVRTWMEVEEGKIAGMFHTSVGKRKAWTTCLVCIIPCTHAMPMPCQPATSAHTVRVLATPTRCASIVLSMSCRHGMA